MIQPLLPAHPSSALAPSTCSRSAVPSLWPGVTAHPSNVPKFPLRRHSRLTSCALWLSGRSLLRATRGSARGRGAFDLGEVVPRQLDIHRAEVLLEPVELCGTGDRHDPRLLPEEPRDRDLRGSRVLLFRDSAEQINERLIGLHCLRCEARQNAAKVVAGEL
jgi:hypothetical protein